MLREVNSYYTWTSLLRMCRGLLTTPRIRKYSNGSNAFVDVQGNTHAPRNGGAVLMNFRCRQGNRQSVQVGQAGPPGRTPLKAIRICSG